jgi:dienelactone hydrolase
LELAIFPSRPEGAAAKEDAMRVAGLMPALLLLLFGCAAEELPHASARQPARREVVAIPLADGTALRAVLALPAGPAARPPVIALHGCAGLGRADRPIRLGLREADWAATLTEAGHPVLFPDSFGSRGLGQACGVRDFPAGPQVRRGDALAAAAWAQAQPWAPAGPVALLGWSHGGSTVLRTIAAPLPPGLIDRAVAYYPGCYEVERTAGWQPAVPALLLLGASDDWTPARFCQALAARFPGQLRQVTYSGARHGFDGPATPQTTRTLPDGRMVSMGTDPAARQASMAEVARFLAGP